MRTFTPVLCAALALLPSAASAQGFGIGPRMTLVRGDAPSGTPSVRFFGGTIRMQSSRRVVLEVAADYKTQMLEGGTFRQRERPIQGSLLLFLSRSRLAPYLLGGYGMYQRTLETLDATGGVVSSLTDKKTGAHVGLGAELFVSRHAALFADYRYRFVRFGDPGDGEESVDIPFTDAIKLSHQGTMWTSGIAFYF